MLGFIVISALLVGWFFGRMEATACRQRAAFADAKAFGNALSGLRTLDLIHGRPGGDVTIADVFKE